MELPDIVKEEIDLLVSGNFILIYLPYQTESERLSILHKIEKEISIRDNFIVLIRHEVAEDSKFISEIDSYIDSYKKNVKILQSTASNVKNGTHPLTNLYMWSKIVINKDYQSDDIPHVVAFPKSLYKLEPNFLKLKINSSILSLHNQTNQRDYVYDNVSDVGIKRYHIRENTIPIHWYDLIEEYKKSYFSFVIETNYGNTSSNYMTEKSVLALITGTIPLILGQKNLITDLEKMGFWVANNDFDFGNLDSFENDSIERTEWFIRTINKISKFGKSEIETYYLSRLNKIQNNWKILSNLFMYKNEKEVGV